VQAVLVAIVHLTLEAVLKVEVTVCIRALLIVPFFFIDLVLATVLVERVLPFLFLAVLGLQIQVYALQFEPHEYLLRRVDIIRDFPDGDASRFFALRLLLLRVAVDPERFSTARPHVEANAFAVLEHLRVDLELDGHVITIASF
jgi:hypothetical protein